MNIFGLQLGLSDTTLHARDATALEQKRATANERDTHAVLAQATCKTLPKVHNLFTEVHTEAMPASNLGAAKRAFVKVLLSLAVSYAAALEVNRDSADSDVMRAHILSQKTKPGDTLT